MTVALDPANARRFAEQVAERVNTSVRVLKRHYDQPTKREELEERRRQYIDRLDFGENGDERE